MYACPGADVDDVVGRANRVLVMLDNNHRVSEVAQIGKRAQEPLVIALMQTYGRFVEHVHHADETCADLAGEPDSLRFASR